MITNVTIGEQVSTKIPEKGYYVELEWMYGDADGYATKCVGPFPEERKELYIEFLNVLQAMIDEYKESGKGGFDDYDHIPGVNKFFDEYDAEDEDTREFLECIGAEMETEPNGFCNVAELIRFEPYYYDGENLNRYNVIMSSEEE